jgi:hypothetical protein
MEQVQSDQKAMEINTETPITITLTAMEWSSILYGVDELPRKTAQPLHEKINGEIIKAAQAAGVQEAEEIPEKKK